MSDLMTFADRVQSVLHDTSRMPHWTPEEARLYMADYRLRRQRFQELAQRLNRTIINPRLETIASYFANSSMHQVPPTENRSSCWFEFCERFPAVTQIEFTVEHDVAFKNLIIYTQTRMMPAFLRFNEQDKLSLPLDSVHDRQVADWVEERLFEFLDTYLRIDGGGEPLGEDLVTDPVCGMRIIRSTAATREFYDGRPYFFCCYECSAKFLEHPTKYVQVNAI